MAALLIYSDFLNNLQLLFESHQPVNWASGKVVRKTILVAFCLKQNHQKKKSLGISENKIVRKTNFLNMDLKKGASYHLILDSYSRGSLASTAWSPGSDIVEYGRYSNGVITLTQIPKPSIHFLLFLLLSMLIRILI